MIMGHGANLMNKSHFATRFAPRTASGMAPRTAPCTALHTAPYILLAPLLAPLLTCLLIVQKASGGAPFLTKQNFFRVSFLTHREKTLKIGWNHQGLL